MKKVNFKEFCEIWHRETVYDPKELDLKEELHDMYVNYKEQDNEIDAALFLHFWYEDLSFDNSSLMLKKKAIKHPVYSKGLLDLIKNNTTN